nr:MAG TPA: hypothetical protein [Caudoviricetes sp.]
MALSSAKKGAFRLLGNNGTLEFDCTQPFYTFSAYDGIEQVVIDSDYSEEIVLMAAAMLSTLSDRSIDRAIKLANVLAVNPKLKVDLGEIDDYIE